MAEVSATRAVAGRIAYGALFAVVLPFLLAAWAHATPLALPALHWPAAGALLFAGGCALVLAGWSELWVRGGGLPMNAFPPVRFVSTGIYGWLAHPIYTGFSLACAGCAIAAGSASGLWLVTPVTVLASAALVLGYESHDLRARFGAGLPRPVLSLPEDSPEPAAQREIIVALLLVAVPWMALYQAAMLLGPGADSRSTFLTFESRLPVIEDAEVIYASTYPFVALSMIAPRTRAEARRLIGRGLLANALVLPFYFTLPLSAPPKPFSPHGPLGALLLQERALDTPAGAFPSFHVLWALLAAEAWAARWPHLRTPARIWAWLIAASCVLTGMHSLLDVLAGVLAFLAVLHSRRIWDALRRAAEQVANTRLEWRIGPVRIFGYGFWAAFGNLVALTMVASMVPGRRALVMASASAGLLGALVSAQMVERPPPEMRPYGFFGGVLGIIVAACASPLFGTPAALVWPLLAAYCCAAPFVQSLGRVRCLIQGCCHGAPAPEAAGIRYAQPLSRVCKAGLGGTPLHPAPLYSILWNGVVALFVLRLWSLHAEAHFICGVYLILCGGGRFVEESYRGEPQTPIIAGLRIYQWVSMAALLAGAVITALGSSQPMPSAHLDGIGAAAVFAIVTWIALGVDFPRSRRRFARLA
ncbi:MAG: diacylglyceryl transferase [Deltaproteobacteria bacterium]|nr:MAG: diacylglyceryl transferase [Deltaproteobacteria bacterium]